MPEDIKVVLYHNTETCSHCKKFEKSGVWKKTKEKFKNKNITFKEETEEKNMPHDDKFNGIPTIRIYKSADIWEQFDDDRTVEALTRFIENFIAGKPNKKEEEEEVSGSLEEFEQCGGNMKGGEEYYKMKYYKYKAKYVYLKSKYT